MLRLLGDVLGWNRRRLRAGERPAARWRGQVEIDFARCTLSGACADACPTPALRLEHDPAKRRAALTLDLGQCVFCGLCEEACGEGAIRLASVWDLAARRREDLVTRGVFEDVGAPAVTAGAAPAATAATPEGARLRRRVLSLLGRSLHVRHVDAGSCGGCESELYAARNPVHDLTRYGIDFVASPRHSDLLLVTGVVTREMAPVLKETHAAMPDPKLVVATGACAIGGGVHGEARDPGGGVDAQIPVDVWIPGCPPHPQAIVHGLLLAVDRAEQKVGGRTWHGAYPAAADPRSAGG